MNTPLLLTIALPSSPPIVIWPPTLPSAAHPTENWEPKADPGAAAEIAGAGCAVVMVLSKAEEEALREESSGAFVMLPAMVS